MGIPIWEIKFKFKTNQIQIKNNVWTRQRRKRIGKGRSKTSSQSSSRQHSRYHQASHPSIGQKRRSQTYFRFDLRRNPRSFESVFGKCHQRRSNLHRTCQEEDSNGHGRRLRVETSRKNSLRIWWINRQLTFCSRTIKRNITTFLSVSLPNYFHVLFFMCQ